MVDAAKFLVCLKSSPYEKVFFSDFDTNRLYLRDDRIEKALNDHGMVIGLRPSSLGEGFSPENRFFGFTARQKPFFEKLFDSSHAKAPNGYWHLVAAIQNYCCRNSISSDSFSVTLGTINVPAYHPAMKDFRKREISLTP